MSMKIWLVTHQFLPEFFAGTETVTFLLARELMARGHNVTVIAGHPSLSESAGAVSIAHYDYEGLSVVRLSSSTVDEKAEVFIPSNFWNTGVLSAFVELLQENKPDVVHVLHFARLGADIFASLKEKSIPVVFTATDFFALCPFSHLRYIDGSHCGGPREDLGNCVRHFLQHGLSEDLLGLLDESTDEDLGNLAWLASTELPEEMRKFLNPGFASQDWFRNLVMALKQRSDKMAEVLQTVDRVIVPSVITREAFARNGLPAAKMRFIPFGLDVNTLKQTQARILGQGPELRLVFIGQIAEHKGLRVLIQALKKLPRELAIHLTVYGDLVRESDYASSILELCDNDARVRFAGSFPPEQLPLILSNYDLIVIPSLWSENTPLVLLASQEMGCPAIVSQEPGLCEIVEYGINGLTFATGNVDELASCITLLAHDRELLKALAENCRRAVSIQEHADVLERVYGELLLVC